MPPQVDLPLNTGPGIPAGERQMDFSSFGSSLNLWMKLPTSPALKGRVFLLVHLGNRSEEDQNIGYSILERGRGGGERLSRLVLQIADLYPMETPIVDMGYWNGDKAADAK